ncbi:MAG: M28 family peptidase [Planctomycetota bacterium]
MSLLLPLLLAALLPQQVEVGPLSTQRLAADLEFLADDAFEGRDSAEFGGHAAARFLATRFAQTGLQKVGDDWLHAFSVKPLMLDRSATFLQLEEHRFQLGDAFFPHPAAPEGHVAGRLVFAGYGIQRDADHYDDLTGLDLRGAVVLVLRFEPRVMDTQGGFLGQELTPEARLQEKLKLLASRGAAAVLLADAPTAFSQVHDSLAVGTNYWPTFSPLYRLLNPLLGSAEVRREFHAMNFQTVDAKDQVVSRMQHQVALASPIPVAYVSRSVAQQMLHGSGITLRAWAEQTDAQPQQARGFDCKKKITLAIHHPWQEQSLAFNVVGMIPGKNPRLAQEYVVIGAHYDHLGMHPDGRIWNGADDNASGVAGLLGLAAHFMQPEFRPRRSLVFVGFSGEERGLLGSFAFLDQRIIPAEKIALMLNLEMIGRTKEQSFTLIGGRSAEGLEGLVQAVAMPKGWTLKENHQLLFDQSDQLGFHRMGIPTLLYTTGAHEDYHRPSDLHERIQLHGMELICRHAASVLHQIDSRLDRLKAVDYLSLNHVFFNQKAKSDGPMAVPFRQRLDY